MKRFLAIALVLAGCLMVAPRLLAQAPAAGESKKPAQPNSSQPGAATQSSDNPFPEDTSTVPVMPSKTPPPLPEGTYREPERAPVPLPGRPSAGCHQQPGCQFEFEPQWRGESAAPSGRRQSAQ